MQECVCNRWSVGSNHAREVPVLVVNNVASHTFPTFCRIGARVRMCACVCVCVRKGSEKVGKVGKVGD